MLKPVAMEFLPPRDIKPLGWLKRQLEIQAKGLSGNLDKMWPDIRDSRWVGGDREGWERVPYWLCLLYTSQVERYSGIEVCKPLSIQCILRDYLMGT